MPTLVYVSSFGLVTLLVIFLKRKLQAVESDLRAHLSRVISARDISGPETWAHFEAQARILESLIIRHFDTED
jgi:hypothetical protein